MQPRSAGHGLLALLSAALLLAPCTAIKLRFDRQECLTYDFKQYEYFYGSFVAQPDQWGNAAKYDLLVTAPSGSKLYEVHGESEATFHLVPVEAGNHRFCLTFNPEKSPARSLAPRDVLWNINIGYSEVGSECRGRECAWAVTGSARPWSSWECIAVEYL